MIDRARVLRSGGGFPGCDFVGHNSKLLQPGGSEGCGDGDVRRIASEGHQYAADSRHVVACVECPPAAIEVSLKPGTEIHGRRSGHADIAEISGRIARWNIQTAAESDRQMLEIAADAAA